MTFSHFITLLCLAIVCLVYVSSLGDRIIGKEAQKLINLCELTVPRGQKCIIIAVEAKEEETS